MNLLMSLEQNIMNLPTQIYSLPSKKNKIISIFCYQELYFMGVNLIGLNFEDFKQLFHHPKSYGVDEYYLSNESYPTYVYEFDEIGVQAWEAKGKVVTIIAGGKDNYSTEPYYDE
ncbi:hypothetical protein predicted by Glimmer/Critica [Neisseria meningitidis WUE 2594]|nr:hypothetical protein predicted by Glimmer/Critica [Neisseria meningitidis WUE 2594]